MNIVYLVKFSLFRVDISPEQDHIGTKKALVYQHENAMGYFVFDGSMLFSPHRFTPDGSPVQVTSQDREGTMYQVKDPLAGAAL